MKGRDDQVHLLRNGSVLRERKTHKNEENTRLKSRLLAGKDAHLRLVEYQMCRTQKKHVVYRHLSTQLTGTRAYGLLGDGVIVTTFVYLSTLFVCIKI